LSVLINTRVKKQPINKDKREIVKFSGLVLRLTIATDKQREAITPKNREMIL
jgi:hypothetical protein